MLPLNGVVMARAASGDGLNLSPSSGSSPKAALSSPLRRSVSVSQSAPETSAFALGESQYVSPQQGEGSRSSVSLPPVATAPAAATSPVLVLPLDGFLRALSDAGLVLPQVPALAPPPMRPPVLDLPAALYCYVRALKGGAAPVLPSSSESSATDRVGEPLGLTPKQVEEALGLVVQLVAGARALASGVSGRATVAESMAAVAAEVLQALVDAHRDRDAIAASEGLSR